MCVCERERERERVRERGRKGGREREREREREGERELVARVCHINYYTSSFSCTH